MFFPFRGDNKQDLRKQRNVSGSRQLPTISDGQFDPMNFLSLIGFERSSDGQDISYSELLVSNNKPKSKQLPQHSLSHEHTTASNYHQHNLVARCFSHDPQLKSTSQQNVSNQMSTSQSEVIKSNSNVINHLSNQDQPQQQQPEMKQQQTATVTTIKQYHHQYHSSNNPVYHPNLLDDPELIAGKHSTLLAFPSYVVRYLLLSIY